MFVCTFLYCLALHMIGYILTVKVFYPFQKPSVYKWLTKRKIQNGGFFAQNNYRLMNNKLTHQVGNRASKSE